MKIKYLAIILMLSMCTLNGCADKSSTYDMEFTESDTIIVTNPFKPDNTAMSPNTEYISYGVNINIPNFESLTCENNKVTLPITIENIGKDFSLGFCIFSDGIIQEYTSSMSEEKTIMQTFDLTTDSIETVDFYIENIENISDNDEVSFSFITMENSDIIPTLENISGTLPHGVSGGDSLHLHMNTLSKSEKYKICNKFDIHTITDEEAKRFAILLDERDTSLSTKFILDPINETGRPRENMIAASEDGKLKLNLYGWTTNGNDSFSANGTYRVSFYKNHERIKFNDDYDYIDVELKENNITIADVTFEDISEGDFIYCFAVPIDNYKLKVKKSMTALVLRPDDMPPPIDEDLLFNPVYIDQNPKEINNGDWNSVEYDEVEEFLKDNSY